MSEHDKSASLLAITDRLDRLEELLSRLLAAVERSGVSAVSTERAAPAGQGGATASRTTVAQPTKASAKQLASTQAAAAPKAKAAPPKASPSKAAQPQPSTGENEAAEPLPSILTEAQRDALKLKDLDLSPWLPGAGASIEEFLTALFRFSFEDREWGDDLMLALVHDEIARAPRTAGSLRQFNFPKMRRLRDRYIDGTDPSSFQIHRIDEYQANEDIRVFIHSSYPGTMPGPVRIKRDEKADGAWRLVQLSL